MIARLRCLFLLTLAFSLAGASDVVGAPKERKESVFLFENRQVVFAMPPDYGMSMSKDERGMFTVIIADKKDRAALQMTFLPDPDGRFALERERKEFIFEAAQELIASSVEKTMRFEDLQSKIGKGTFCSFTDEAMVGKKKLPADARPCSTTGVKAWPGVVAAFTLVSSGPATKEHQVLMALLRDSVEEAPRQGQ